VDAFPEEHLWVGEEYPCFFHLPVPVSAVPPL
jgi:hypothetical protein